MAVRARPKQSWKEQELSVLHQVAQHISSNLELNELLSRIVDMVVSLTGADSCFIYLYSEQNNELTLRAANTRQRNIVGEIRLKLGEGVTGWAAREKTAGRFIEAGLYRSEVQELPRPCRGQV